MALNLSPSVNRLSNGMIGGIRHTSVYCPWFPRPTTSTGCSNWLGPNGSRLQGFPCTPAVLPIDCWQRWRVRHYTLRSLLESGGISGKQKRDGVPWLLHRKSICSSYSFSIQRHYPLIGYQDTYRTSSTSGVVGLNFSSAYFRVSCSKAPVPKPSRSRT